MGLVTEKWNIACRPCKGFRDTDAPYRKFPGDAGGWYADPFLFEYDGTIYLFAEYFSYRTRKGSIVVFTYDKNRNDFTGRKEILCEDFHMSYPLVFSHGNSIYMLPETEQAGALILYRAVRFPYEWKKEKVLYVGRRLVDTTLLPDGGAVSQALDNGGAPEAFLLLMRDGTGVSVKELTHRPLRRCRPGGAFFRENEITVATAQDCADTYGGALEFYDFATGETLFRLSPENINIAGERGQILGVHTYNRCGGIEVIDYKTGTVSLNRIANRAVSLLKRK